MRFLIFVSYISFHTLVYSQTSFHDSWLDPLVICSSENFTIENFGPVEGFPQSDFESCIKPFENLSRFWLKFQVTDESSISFTLSPLNFTDDIDFAIYSSSKGVPGKVLRCMATGILLDRASAAQPQCSGETGLSNLEKDLFEPPGCSKDQNNFVSTIHALPGEEFYILVTNFNSNKGFKFRWNDEINLDSQFCDKETVSPSKIDISVFPNPAKGQINCNIQSNIPRAAVLYLIDNIGNIIESEQLILVKGLNSLDINLSNYPSGTYYILVAGNDKAQKHIKFEVIK